MALDPKALVALADMKAILGGPPAGGDAVLEMLINQVSAMVDTYLSRTLIETTYTDLTLDGLGSEFLYLPNWPISALTSVKEDGITLTLGTDFVRYADRGILRRISTLWAEGLTSVNQARWSDGIQNVVVTYTAGYALAAVPRDIQFLVFNKVAAEWQRQKNSWWGQTSKSTDSGSLNFEVPVGLSDDEIAILAPHKRLLV